MKETPHQPHEVGWFGVVRFTVEKDNDENGKLKRRRAKLTMQLPDEAEMRRLLADDHDQMTLRESACYIAGYVAGFANASEELAP